MHDFKGQPSKVRISEREIEISGPADFVERQIDKHFETLRVFVDMIKSKHELHQNSNLQISNTTSTKSNPQVLINANDNVSDYAEFEEVQQAGNAFEKYESVFAINNDKIHIMTNVPGSSLGQRMVNLVIMYLWIRYTQKIDRVPFSELRDTCELHGELDAGHFAVYMKKNKKLFIIDGDSRNMFAKLTVPGIKEAERILNSLNN